MMPVDQFPKVSIITPSFNQAAFLEQTMLSVLNQGYPNLEYMVVDGGSTDGSVDIIRKYSDRLAWWVSEKDAGQADAINKGFARASGEIIGWLNSDDLYQPGAVVSAVIALQSDPNLALVYGNLLSIDGTGRVINVQRFGNWGLKDLMRFRIIGQPAVFMRRSALEKAGFLDLHYHFMLDTHLWLRVAQHGTMEHVNEIWACARFHENAKNVAKALEYAPETYQVLAWMQAQPVLRPLYLQDRSRIWAGYHLLAARYQLDGGDHYSALKSYLRCFLAYPPAVRPELHRVAYAAASLVVNPAALRRWYLQRKARQAQSSENQRLQSKASQAAPPTRKE